MWVNSQESWVLILYTVLVSFPRAIYESVCLVFPCISFRLVLIYLGFVVSFWPRRVDTLQSRTRCQHPRLQSNALNSHDSGYYYLFIFLKWVDLFFSLFFYKLTYANSFHQLTAVVITSRLYFALLKGYFKKERRGMLFSLYFLFV
jgi:hypothetical protein